MSDDRQRRLALAILLLVPVLVITAAVASDESQLEAAENGGPQVGAVAEEHSKRSTHFPRHNSADQNESKLPASAGADRPLSDLQTPERFRPALDRQVQDVPLIEAKPETADQRSKQPPPAVPDQPPTTTDSKREESSQPAQQKPKQEVPAAEGRPETPDEQSKQAPSTTSDRPPAPDTEADKSAKQPDQEKPEQEVRLPESKPDDGLPTAKTLKPIAPDEAVGILGKKVHGPAGEDMGMVVDVLVDGEGKPVAALIDFGGFLGVGTRKVATDWQLIQFRPADRTQPVLLSLGKEELRAAPEYKPSIHQAEIVAPPPPEKPAAPDAEK
jgi:PRC-barrel domain